MGRPRIPICQVCGEREKAPGQSRCRECRSATRRSVQRDGAGGKVGRSGIEPMYSVPVACELVPCTEVVMRRLFHDRPDLFGPARYMTAYTYRHYGPNGYRTDEWGGPSVRMLSETEVLNVRGVLIRFTKRDPYRPGVGKPFLRVARA